MKVQANNFTIFWNGAAIAYATTAEMDVNADVHETGSATSGDWRNYIKGRKGWTISAGHLYDLRGKQHNGDNYRNPFELVVKDMEVDVAFGAIVPHCMMDAKDMRLTGAALFSGKVLVRRYTVSSVKGQYVSCQFEAIGCGKLEEIKSIESNVVGLGIVGQSKVGYNY